MNDSILQVKSISKSYKDVEILSEVSLQLKSGVILGLLGDNGSGKTTLMSILSGTKKANSGSILYNGKEITKQSRLKIGYVPQYPILIEYLTVLDNLKLWVTIYGLESLQKANIPEFLEMESMYKKKVSQLSGGMKKRLSIAIALMNRPEFLILDEAFAALDLVTVQHMMKYLKNNKEIGVLYSSHNIYEVAELCDQAVVLKGGKIQYESKNINKLGIDGLKAVIYK